MSLRIPQDVADRLKQSARASGMPASELVRKALAAYLSDDRMARLERKIDAVLDMMERGATPSRQGASEGRDEVEWAGLGDVDQETFEAFSGMFGADDDE